MSGVITEQPVKLGGRPPKKYKPSVRERIDDLISTVVGTPIRGETTPETRFVEDLQADSIDVTELACALEDEFGLTIPDEWPDKVVFVQDVYRYVERRVKA